MSTASSLDDYKWVESVLRSLDPIPHPSSHSLSLSRFLHPPTHTHTHTFPAAPPLSCGCVCVCLMARKSDRLFKRKHTGDLSDVYVEKKDNLERKFVGGVQPRESVCPGGGLKDTLLE